MALWGDTDTLAHTPNFEAPSFSFDGTDAAVVVVASDHIIIPEHGLATGETVTYTASTAAVGGLTSGTIYHPIWVDADTIQLAANVSDAAGGTEITLTGVSDDTDTIQVTPSDVYFVDVTEAGIAANRAKGLGRGLIRDVDSINLLVDRLDIAIDKMSKMSSHTSQLLAVHNRKIEAQERLIDEVSIQVERDIGMRANIVISTVKSRGCGISSQVSQTNATRIFSLFP